MANWKIGNYTFRSQAEYEKAKSELDFIKRANEKYNLNDPQIAGRILAKFKPQTIIGRQFCERLQNTCQKRAIVHNSVEVENSLGPSNVVIYDPAKIEILRRLKRYNNTYECQCLECGYKGPMGVVSNGSKGKKILAFVISSIIFILFVPRLYWGFGVTIGGILLFALISWFIESKLKADQKTLYCPNCEKILKTK